MSFTFAHKTFRFSLFYVKYQLDVVKNKDFARNSEINFQYDNTNSWKVLNMLSSSSLPSSEKHGGMGTDDGDIMNGMTIAIFLNDVDLAKFLVENDGFDIEKPVWQHYRKDKKSMFELVQEKKFQVPEIFKYFDSISNNKYE